MTRVGGKGKTIKQMRKLDITFILSCSGNKTAPFSCGYEMKLSKPHQVWNKNVDTGQEGPLDNPASGTG